MKRSKRGSFYICDQCGASLDPGEKCDCEFFEEADFDRRNRNEDFNSFDSIEEAKMEEHK